MFKQAGYQTDFRFSDAASGKVLTIERPQTKALLPQMRDGEQLVVSKLGRLGHAAQYVAATFKALTKRRIEVIVLRFDKLDLMSSAGKLTLAMLSAVPEMERDFLVERKQA